MISLALIGQKITHSRSPELYQRLWKNWPSSQKREEKISYKILNYQKEDPPPNLEEIFTENNLLGLNITSPWKAAFQEQITYTHDFLGPLGIVNCVKRKKGKLWAANTDSLAVRDLLMPLKEKIEQYVLFGDGAMAKVFLFIKNLKDKKTPCHHYFRKIVVLWNIWTSNPFYPIKGLLL